jgi:hypothetical protein
MERSRHSMWGRRLDQAGGHQCRREYHRVLPTRIAGWAWVPPQGFLRYADGHIIIIDAPQANSAVGAQPVSMSDFDEIAGTYIAAIPSVFTRSGAGVLTTIQVPGGGSAVATAINASGSVVGYSGYTGFVAHPDGYWAEIAIPVLPGCAKQTIPDGVNASGLVLQRHLIRLGQYIVNILPVTRFYG